MISGSSRRLIERVAAPRKVVAAQTKRPSEGGQLDYKRNGASADKWPHGSVIISNNSAGVPTIRSVRHQCRFGHRGKHTTCRPAKNKFPQPGMPVPAHDNEIGICIGCI
jgi:hypothetical protein